ncbi:MAG: hypothetical protein GTN97_03175 [Nitrosopumilaceae archaeon]|nr:hypothetical protein [Nitrosopumilaceae archaeon]NIP10589.1 hypothetical protein [Nitrosopumilaceae archaeon]NIS94912.1 hypothetical protein [Nitrosopumilaceae archaeon]
MDEKEVDKSKESLQNHLLFYKKLNNTIFELENEIEANSDSKIIEHLTERIKAINLDKERIRKLFPHVKPEVWENK